MGKILRNITMDGTRFGLDLKLQNLSMISIAAKLWDSQDIKIRIKNHFSRREYRHHHVPDKNWCEISKLVVQYSNSINLPPSLSVLLKNTILLVGQKIYDWIFYVTETLELDFIFTHNVHFSLGVIDEIKIFDLYWRDLMAPNNFIHQTDYFGHSPLFSLACMFGYEKFVKERKNEMLDELSEFYPDIKTGDEIYNIMSVSMCLTTKISVFENVGSPQRLFEVCLEKGFSKAARYYWEKLDEVEKVSNVTNFAKKCWLKDDDASFLKEKYCENLLFLIDQMGEEERYLFFTEYADEIIRLFLPIWPYQELMVDLLKYDWNIESSRLLEMAKFLIWFSVSLNFSLELPLDNELVFQIMQKAWRNIPVSEKLSFLTNNEGMFYGAFLTLNPEILNLLCNDPSITEVDGKKMDYFIKEGFLDLVLKGKCHFLNTIIDLFLNFIPEPKEYLKEYFSDSFWYCMLIENDESFGFVDQFLDWLAESEAERTRLKNEINTISVCRYFTESEYIWDRFELADKFLKWRLETDAEIRSFKEEMKSYNFVIVGFMKYIRIKSGDLSWFGPGYSLAIHPDEHAFDNADGLSFLKFEDACELNPGVVLGVESIDSDVDYDYSGRDRCHPERWYVEYVGTKVGDFIVLTVRQIWINKVGSYYSYSFCLGHVVYFSNSFIKFYYETDEEVLNFKKTKLHVLVTENVMEFLVDAFYAYGDVPENFLDNFCDFCMSSEEIEDIKIRQRSDIEKFLDTYLIDERKFDLIDIYLNWLFGEVQKTEVCKKFLNSSNKAALLCLSYLKCLGEANPLSYDWDPDICRWLSLVDDMEKLKNDAVALYGNTPEWFPALLDSSARTGAFLDFCAMFLASE